MKKLEKIEFTPRIKALTWYSVLSLTSLLCGCVSWSYTGGRDGFLNILLVLIAIVFFLLSGVAVAGIFYVARTSEEDFAKHSKRSSKKGQNPTADEAAAPVEVELPDATSKPRPANKKPRPANKKPRPANKPDGAAVKKPRPVKKPVEKS